MILAIRRPLLNNKPPDYQSGSLQSQQPLLGLSFHLVRLWHNLLSRS